MVLCGRIYVVIIERGLPEHLEQVTTTMCHIRYRCFIPASHLKPEVQSSSHCMRHTPTPWWLAIRSEQFDFTQDNSLFQPARAHSTNKEPLPPHFTVMTISCDRPWCQMTKCFSGLFMGKLHVCNRAVLVAVQSLVFHKGRTWLV